MSLRLYLDEDVDLLLAPMLAARGHDCLTTQAAGRLQASDEDQLHFATAEGRILLTHNRVDFAAWAIAWHQASCSHAGILMMFRRNVNTLAGKTDQILQLYDQNAWRDQTLLV